LTPPPGAPGVWDWWMPYYGWKGATNGVPTADGALGEAWVTVSGLTIYDAAGFYPGGQMNIYISCD